MFHWWYHKDRLEDKESYQDMRNVEWLALEELLVPHDRLEVVDHDDHVTVAAHTLRHQL